MGRIANRLARKKDPLYATAKEIVRCAVGYVQTDDLAQFSELTDLLADSLEALPSEDFARMLSIVRDNTEPRRDGEDLMDAILGTLEASCEVMDIEDVPTGYLMAVPLALESGTAPQDTFVSAADAEKLSELLKESELVADDANVTFFPRLISAEEAQSLLHGDVHRLLNRMYEGALPEALAVLAQAGNRTGAPATPLTAWPAQSRYFAGILVGYVKTEDSEPFPLDRALTHEIALARESAVSLELGALDETACAAMAGTVEGAMAEARADVRDAMAQVAPRLAAVLGANSLTVIQPPEDWFYGVGHAIKAHREAVAKNWLVALTAALGLASPSELCASEVLEPLPEDAYGAFVAIYLKSTGAQVGRLEWRALEDEDADDCFDALNEVLGSQGLQPFKNAGGTALSSANASKTLH